MKLSKKKWKKLKKRVADLEKVVQNQPLDIISTLYGIRKKEMEKSKCLTPYQKKD